MKHKKTITKAIGICALAGAVVLSANAAGQTQPVTVHHLQQEIKALAKATAEQDAMTASAIMAYADLLNTQNKMMLDIFQYASAICESSPACQNSPAVSAAYQQIGQQIPVMRDARMNAQAYEQQQKQIIAETKAIVGDHFVKNLQDKKKASDSWF